MIALLRQTAYRFFVNQRLKLSSLTSFLSSVVFPYYLVLTYTLLLIEVATYKGFLSNYLLVNSDFFFYTSIFLLLSSWINRVLYEIQEKSSAEQITLTINRLMTIPIFIIHYILISMEQAHFPNYVFSQYHINLDNLQTIVNLNWLVLVSDLVTSRFNVYTHFVSLWLLFKRNVWHFLFVVSVLLFFISQLLKVGNNMIKSSILVLNTLGDSYDEKMIRMLGGKEYSGWIYHYGQFVTRNTPETAVIFIPPQLQSWEMEGNPWYFRWFVYPRKLLSARKIDTPVPPTAEYILIAHGTWIWGASDFGWPKQTIPASEVEKIILIDRETLEERTLEAQEYQLQIEPEQWGIIKLKK